MSIRLENEIRAMERRITDLEKQVAELIALATKPAVPVKKAS